jgi:hypothetical protein
MGVLSSEVKKPEHGTYHSHPSRTKVKNHRSYISTTLYAFMAKISDINLR